MAAVLVIAGAVCLLLAILLVADLFHQRARARALTNWPRTDAEIIDSAVAQVLAWHEVETGAVYLW